MTISKSKIESVPSTSTTTEATSPRKRVAANTRRIEVANFQEMEERQAVFIRNNLGTVEATLVFRDMPVCCESNCRPLHLADPRRRVVRNCVSLSCYQRATLDGTETEGVSTTENCNVSDEEGSSDLALSSAQQGDIELLRRASSGDFEAFSALVERFQRRVFAVARRIAGSEHDAEDVTQQTFLSVLDHLSDFREESSVATWILRIATNHALKVLRKRRGLPTVSLDAQAGDGEDTYAALPHPEFIAQWRDEPSRLAQQAEVRRLIEAALDELPEKYRVIFVLRDVEGLSVKETAEALGLTEANVKVRLMRARLDLRERLTRALGDEATRTFPSHDHDG